ncbi:MAG: LytTR family DNA-binding domain-containing protein [Pseudomonadota bacterium]
MPESKRRVLIADDEPAAREELKRVIASFSELELIAECSDGSSTVSAIASKKPDIVFLDIDMPEMNGFGVAKSTAQLPYHLVFLTAHHKFALKAFDTNAIDFLLKPARPTLVARCIEKILRQETLVKERISSDPTENMQLVFEDGVTSRIVEFKHILMIGALGRYRRLFLTEQGAAVHRQQTLVSNKTLEDLSADLDAGPFIRVHRSYIVNMSKVIALRYRRRRHFLLIEGENDEVPVARSQVKTVRSWLEQAAMRSP